MLIPQPSYVSYVPCRCTGRWSTGDPIELKAENEFRLTAEELEACNHAEDKASCSAFPKQPDRGDHGKEGSGSSRRSGQRNMICLS